MQCKPTLLILITDAFIICLTTAGMVVCVYVCLGGYEHRVLLRLKMI